MLFNAALISDQGRVRTNNEDNYNFFGTIREDVSQRGSSLTCKGDTGLSACAVYDGMGGEASGEIASLVAAGYIKACPLPDMVKAPIEQIHRANEAVRAQMEKMGGVTMGCTATALYFAQDRCRCVNIGDSRCYLFRRAQLTTLTVDHSEAQGFIDDHSLTEDEAKTRRSWHVLTRYLGGNSDTTESEPHISDMFEVLPGDIFLLCTDGLTDMVSDAAIRAILSFERDPLKLAGDLVDMALMAGGRDNITVLVISVEQ